MITVAPEDPRPVDPARLETSALLRSAQTARLDQSVHFIEQLRKTLHLVDHHPSLVILRDLVRQPLRGRQELCVDSRVEEVEKQCARQMRFQPRRLAGAPRAEQKKALAIRYG